MRFLILRFFNIFQNIIADHAIDIINSVDPEKEQLYLYLPFQSVHSPYEVRLTALRHFFFFFYLFCCCPARCLTVGLVEPVNSFH